MISFIIPIYNTKIELLERCFNSILKLTNLEYEVLLIDDGSKSFVEEFCKKFIKNYSNFIFFKKENEGVSQARNLGIKLAKGDFIFFIDSDDTIVAKNLENLKIKKKVDLVLFDFKLIEKNKKLDIQVLKDSENSIELNPQKVLLGALVNRNLNSSWAKLYSRDFLLKNNIFFNSQLVTGEDLNFNLNFLNYNPVVIYKKIIVYNYYREEESSKNRLLKYKEKQIENCNYLEKTKLEILKQMNLPKKNIYIGKIVSQKIIDTFNLIIDSEEEKILNFKNKVKANIKDDLKYIKHVNFFIKIRYFLMYFELWEIIKIVGKFRKKYLKLKKIKI
ncbi:MAG: glycosyltransferase family 2 protein [Fusobacterium sp.]|uniref:glycosyltransferase family 2 protein n=1 Tax=Fusobacterium sp. TaxID=68766 RepID=UPI00399956FC